MECVKRKYTISNVSSDFTQLEVEVGGFQKMLKHFDLYTFSSLDNSNGYYGNSKRYLLCLVRCYNFFYNKKSGLLS